ncbi:putative sulfate/molybdate transporter [Lutibaculum baratangense]|uniref:Benzoate membrane transport protein n=1 Tax=Lutibaculum baratangense AMV1 TaxID=631454 RepID=V4RA92_9HYPH|nr:putative sulfate/molybdate transporter [Lutibaculum baratangense]ESR23096.1 Benzoate membrane transport protein [Lutibaculum baratangense AMV1]
MAFGRSRTDATERHRRRSLPGDLGGAFGDLGTLLPYALGAATIGGLSAVGVFGGFAVFLIATGLFYGIPIAVQPMKAVGAVVMTGGLSPAEVLTAGVAIGGTMLVLGASGLAVRLARLVPQSVTTGLQLGLGLAMISIGLTLMAGMPWLAAASVAFLMAALRWPRVPSAAVLVVGAVTWGILFPQGEATTTASQVWGMPPLPSPAEIWSAMTLAVLPQLALTLTNAVILTAALSRDLFGVRAHRANERNLSLTTGIFNLLLAPFGALPMCHGAGGLQAQWRFGARSGLAPVALGVGILVLLVVFGAQIVTAVAAMPMAVLGALLAFAGADLATSKRLFDARPRCWPTIAVAAALTLFLDAAWGLAGGILTEKLTDTLVRLRRDRAAGRTGL